MSKITVECILKIYYIVTNGIWKVSKKIQSNLNKLIK